MLSIVIFYEFGVCINTLILPYITFNDKLNEVIEYNWYILLFYCIILSIDCTPYFNGIGVFYVFTINYPDTTLAPLIAIR